MVPRKMKRKAERRLRQLLAEGGFSQPEDVRYDATSVVLLWPSVDKAIVVEVTERGEVGESRIGPSPQSPKNYRGLEKAARLTQLQAQRLELQAAEHNARAMLDNHGLLQPDDVEYGDRCIRLLWHEERLAVVVELAERAAGPPPLALVADDGN